ncbi:hypothetical protein SAMD00023353_1202210 [Rosellinia necatrix]|uniref:Uncharacterized protein n=1 Tax=Rosellinia necatrix TaxID=77044 RepID=A0A1W2TKJ9_ROSNE|nr:hypothetical protein SAMD00023353_1202210 [Rosellinia necatrix]
MLSRSGLSIRKLIPHRRLSDEDLIGAESRREETLPSWTDQNASGRYSRRKQAPPPIIATSPLTHSDILRPLPPLPSQTPRSSASSSCKCERHSECDCPLLSWKRRSPVYSIPPREDGEDVSLVSCVNNSSPDEAVTHHIPRSRFYSFDASRSKEDLTRALSPEDEHKEEMPKKRRSEGSPSRQLSDDAQQFMQEAENAFKAIGSTLSEVHTNRATIPNITKVDPSGSLDMPRDLEPTPPTPPPKEFPMLLSKSTPAKALSMLGSSAPDTPPNINPVQKPRRKKSKKSKQARSMRSTRKPVMPKQSVRTGPRWTLSENVSELLTGRLFHRIEADEMLTPAQIEAFKQKRITTVQVDKMAEALEHGLEGTSMEPFDLDDLPLRTASAGPSSGMERRVEEDQSAISFSGDVVQRNFLFESQPKLSTSSNPPRNRPAFHKKNTFPTMSTRHTRSASRRLMTELPIIPETNITPRTSDDLYFSNESNDSLGNAASEYVYLRSSPYSLTTPAIQHGPIRLPKPDTTPNLKFGRDDGLDWTAFQMAILGGSGDLYSDGYGFQGSEEADEAAGIVEWWNSWNFEGTGKLITSEYVAASPTSTLSGDEIPDLSHSEIESDNNHSPYRGMQEARRRTRAPGLQLDLGFAEGKKHTPSPYFSDARGNTDDIWRRDSEEKQVVENVNSLPPSPMLDLRVIRSPNGDDLDVVPMGYNLGHDLGDFLKWEAEHAYAGDFSSPTGLM